MGGVVVDVVNCNLVLLAPFAGNIATTVAIAGKFGEATAAHFNSDAMPSQKDICRAPEIDVGFDDFTCLQQLRSGQRLPIAQAQNAIGQQHRPPIGVNIDQLAGDVGVERRGRDI